MNSREWAVNLIDRGWWVFPIPPNTKVGWKGWPEASTNDYEYVRDTWPDDDANIGIHCGPSGLLVLDIDVVGSYSDALSEVGTTAIPDTFTVQTASGKWHLYFSVPLENAFTNRVKVEGTQVDVRVNNGLVVGPGSMIDGSEYKIIYDDPVAPLSDSPRLAKWVKPKPRTVRPVTRSIWDRNKRSNQKAKDGILQIILEAPDGELNSRLYWASCRAGEMVAIGEWEMAEAELALTQAATEANLEPWRIGPTIQSGLRRGMSDES